MSSFFRLPLLATLTVSLSLPVSLLACAARDDASPPEETARAIPEALTSSLPAGVTNVITSGSVGIGACGVSLCQISVGTAQLGVFGPPQYIAFVRRGKGCGGSIGYQILGQNYRRQTVAIAKGAGGEVAIAAAESVGMSGSSPNKLVVWRLDPTTLVTLAGAGLAVPPTGGNPVNATLDLTSLAFTVPGDVVVTGTKIGDIPGQLGLAMGASYQATYAGFATSTASNVAPTQLLAF